MPDNSWSGIIVKSVVCVVFQSFFEFYYFVAKEHSIRCKAEEEALTAADLYHGLKVVQPSAMKEFAIEKPNVSYIVCFLFDFTYLLLTGTLI